MQQTLTRTGFEKIKVARILDKGNLQKETMIQVMDIEIYKGNRDYPPKLSIKIGKGGNKEHMQTFATRRVARINEIIESLKQARYIMEHELYLYRQNLIDQNGRERSQKKRYSQG